MADRLDRSLMITDGTQGSACGDCPWPPTSLGPSRWPFGLQADSRRLSRDFEAKLGVGSLNAALAVNTVGMWPHPTARATRTRPAIAARRADRYGFPAPLPRCHRSHLCGGRQRAGSPAYRSRVRARPNRSARPRPPAACVLRHVFSRAPPVARPRLYRHLGMVPQVAPPNGTAVREGECPGDDAGVRGPACSGYGHVDRLITSPDSRRRDRSS